MIQLSRIITLFILCITSTSTSNFLYAEEETLQAPIQEQGETFEGEREREKEQEQVVEQASENIPLDGSNTQIPVLNTKDGDKEDVPVGSGIITQEPTSTGTMIVGEIPSDKEEEITTQESGANDVIGLELSDQLTIESDSDTLFLTDTQQFLQYIGTAIIPNQERNSVHFRNHVVFSSPIGNIQALIPSGTHISTSDKNRFNLAGFGIGEGSQQLIKKVEVVDSEGNIIIKEMQQDGFSFGVHGQHLIFSQPIQLTMHTALEDGADIEVLVKHEGDMNFNTQGLTTNPQAQCLGDGSTDSPSNKVSVKSGTITFYSCGASVFSVSYVGGANFANFADASIAPGYVDKIVNFAVGSPFPAGSLIKDVNVTIDFRPIDTQNPTSFGTSNCYPNEKYFRLTSPVGTQVNIINAGQLTTPSTNCPRVNLIFDDDGTTALGNNYNRASGSSRGPASPLSVFDNQSPFGNWTLRMGDTTNADGVILFGFTITIETYDLPLCIFSPNQATIPQFQVKNTTQTYEYQFDNRTVQDPKGSNSGYYTTLQIGNLNGPNAQSIANSQIQRKADPVTLVNGTANPLVVLGSAMGAYHLATATDTFIKRDPAPNSNRTGTYGSRLRIKVDIPAYTRPGIYTGTITYTLYENP